MAAWHWRHNEPNGVSNQPHECLLNLYSGEDQRKHQNSAWLAFVWGIHRWPVNSPPKGPVTRKCFHLMTSSWSSSWCICRHTLRWRHNGLDSVPNHQPHDCLLNCSFGHRSKITSKLRVTGLCVGNSPVTGEFPAQMASNAENFSIWWRHPERWRSDVLHNVFASCRNHYEYGVLLMARKVQSRQTNF